MLKISSPLSREIRFFDYFAIMIFDFLLATADIRSMQDGMNYVGFEVARLSFSHFLITFKNIIIIHFFQRFTGMFQTFEFCPK